jgi:excisionase family DNA binding protein
MTTDVAVERTLSTDANHNKAGFATPTEAAGFLRLSRATIHKLIGAGKIPACRYGRAVRIPWSWLQAQALQAER